MCGRTSAFVVRSLTELAPAPCCGGTMLAPKSQYSVIMRDRLCSAWLWPPAAMERP